MNLKQRALLIFSAAMVLVSGLFPPVVNYKAGDVEFNFLFSAVGNLEVVDISFPHAIVWSVLFCEWGTVLLVTGLLYAALRAVNPVQSP